MANMTFKASLLPNTDLGYSLGSDDKRWNIYGNQYQQFERISTDKNNSFNVTTYIIDLMSKGYEGGWFIVQANPGRGCPTEDANSHYQISWQCNTKTGNGINLIASLYGSDYIYEGFMWRNSTNLPVWRRLVTQEFADDRYVNVTGDTMTGTLAFNKTSDGAIISNRYNGTNYNTIRNHNNGNISLSASGAGLFIGYENTTGVNILGTKSNFSGTTLRVGESSSGSEGQIRAVGGAGLIYLYSQTSTTGNRGLYGTNASGTSVSILTVNKDNGVYLNGNAATASKLATAKNIAIAGAVTGNANFDGSANITITTSVSHNHDSLYHAIHTNSWDFSTKQPLSKWVTFDQSAPTGGPDSSWYNGFVSSHNNYLASFIINKHRTSEWYVGWEQYNTSSNTMASAPTWYQLLHTGNYASWTVTKTGGGASGTWGISITGNAMGVGLTGYLSADGSTHTVVSYIKALVDGGKQSGWFTMDGKAGRGCPSDSGNWQFHYWAPSSQGNGVNILCFQYGAAAIYHGYFWRTAANSSAPTWKLLWKQGDAVTGAVWNDYAEFRQADTIEPGYILIEKGDDTLIKSTKRLQDFAGVSSDTWGFAQGETENAKTPIAVAGRVLVYTDKDRKYFKTGDYVCTGKDGKVSKMHWWEKILFPHKVVGVISSVPEYEEWGGGDRPPVKVDGRVWIKVCQ